MNNIQLFKWEIIFTFQFVLSCYYKPNDENNSKILDLSSSYMITIIIMITKYYFEGYRISNIISIIFPFLYSTIRYIFEINHYIIDIIIISLCIFGQIYFPMHKIPNNTGKYKVGYKEFQMEDSFKTEVSIFYPTKQLLGNDSNWCNSQFYQKWQQRFASNNFFIDLFFKIFFSFMPRLKMNVIKDASILQEKLNIIIFSHGFSAHRNSYTCFTNELASQGYVVFSLEHYESMIAPGYWKEKNETKKFNIHKKFRRGSIEDRYQQIDYLIQFITCNKNINTLFQPNVVSLKVDQIVLMGHSLGGASIMYTAFKYQERKNNLLAGIVALDPPLFFIIDEYKNTKLNLPIAFINSHYFQDRVPEYKLRKHNIDFFKQNQDNNKLFGYLRFTDHIQQSDVPFLLPRETKLFKMVTFDHLNNQCIEMHRKLIQIFLEKIVFNQYESVEREDKEELIQEFEQFCEKKYGLADFFVDEYLVFKDFY